jgi:hypothetical protein
VELVAQDEEAIASELPALAGGHPVRPQRSDGGGREKLVEGGFEHKLVGCLYICPFQHLGAKIKTLYTSQQYGGFHPPYNF